MPRGYPAHHERRCIFCAGTYIGCQPQRYCSEECRLRSRVKIVRECWEWCGPRDAKGYGIIQIARTKSGRAHRYAFEVWKERKPGSLMVCHTCDNPSCINPDHLFLGTAKDNAEDMVRKGRQGDHRVPKPGNRRFSPEQVKAIRADTRSQRAIADEYGTEQTVISAMKRRKTYRDIA